VGEWLLVSSVREKGWGGFGAESWALGIIIEGIA
jgi:hypothetical protein